jgi:hypothetical protein
MGASGVLGGRLDPHPELAPEQIVALRGMLDAVESGVGEAIFQLIRSRVDLILGSETEGPGGTLASVGLPLKTAIVAFVDQFVIDVSAVTDQIIEDLVACAGVPLTHAIVNSAWVIEAVTRSRLVLDQVVATVPS